MKVCYCLDVVGEDPPGVQVLEAWVLSVALLEAVTTFRGGVW